MPLGTKYVVFKAEEWEEFRGQFEKWLTNSAVPVGPQPDYPDPIDDCVVIRHQDIFASSGLYAYGTSILTAVEMVEKLFDSPVIESKYDMQQELERLKELSHNFIDEAIKAEQYETKKVPD